MRSQKGFKGKHLLPLGLSAALLLSAVVVSAGSSSRPSTAEEARTVFSRRCLRCHGTDKLADLDLRSAESAVRGGRRGRAVVPADPAASLLYRVVTLGDPVRMPPSGSLATEEQAVLRRWIAAGAPTWSAGADPAYWAFRPISSPTTPRVKHVSWVKSPLDAFVLAKLEQRGLGPAPPADRREWIRRVTFDLHGLPPAPEETDSFVRDADPRAFEKVVDRLLASRRYGEHWGRHWLDIVRFAESQGFERDKLRDHAWRYRDYVIGALNDDLPFDRFVEEQLAGDALRDAGRSSISATGFLVAGPWDEVGATQPSQVMRARAREDELEDMVGATTQTFLGLTVNCARCHDHKFDPIPQKDYYRIQAALAGVRHGDRSLLSPTESQAQASELRRVAERVEALETELAEVEASGRQIAAARWAAERAPSLSRPEPLLIWRFDRERESGFGTPPYQLIGGARVRHGRLVLNGSSAYARTEPLIGSIGAKTLEAWVDLGSLDQRGGAVITLEEDSGTVFDALTFGERQLRRWQLGSEFFRRSRDLTAPDEQSEPGTLVHVALTIERNGQVSLYRNGQPYGAAYVPDPVDGKNLWTAPSGRSRVLFGLRHSAAAKPGANAWFKGEIEEARLYDRALSAAEVRASLAAGPPLVTRQQSLESLPVDRKPAQRRLAAALQEAKDTAVKLAAVPKAYAANPQAPGPVFVLKRGDIAQKDSEAMPGGLSCLPELPADFGMRSDTPEGERRRRLAAWITDRKNPLTARVLANRIWQYHFGRGIVATPSDFGVNGERPTHPELLDWLASELKDRHRWRMKPLHRELVLSSTYRQAARFNPAAARLDADNKLLWQFPPRRLTAEEVRDAMLEAAGNLNRSEGGPGFRPFDITIANTHFYEYRDKLGPEFNRRSVYRTVVNSGAVPLLEAFDCPDPSVKTPRRGNTVTPMQALQLLNSSFVLRQASALAERCETAQPGPPGPKVDLAYRLALQRLPSSPERARGLTFVARYGLRAFCRVLLNSSEFLYTR